MPGQLAAESLAEAVFGNPELARSVYGKFAAKRASTPVFVDPAAWEASLPNCAAIGQNSMPLIDIMGIIGGARVGFVLRALEQQTGSDLMSAPKVTVLSGKTAEIVVAQEFRYSEEYDAILSSVGTSSDTLSGSLAG